MYTYIKALHIIFVVTWFSGLFYIVRLFIYNSEAGEKDEPARSILRSQFQVMIRRLWFGITWPSAILATGFGIWTWIQLGVLPNWLLVKLFFVVGLIAYHLSLHSIYRQQSKGQFRYSSQQLRYWNEVATIFLFAIVTLAAVKQGISVVYGLVGLLALMVVLIVAIKIYKSVRKKQ